MVRRDDLLRSVRAFVTPGPRMIDEAECVASVLLAIVLAHWVGARAVAWAAFTGFVLMRGHVSETLQRGVMRLAGTLLGGACALLIAPYAARWLPLAVVSAAVIGAIGLYGVMTARRAYAWLLFGLTFEMILLDKLEHPALDTIEFFRTRMLEVAAGTVACVIVSLLSTLTARRRWPVGLPPLAARMVWHRGAARHAMQGGVALALLPVLHAIHAVPQSQQAGVTIMAVMIVPIANLGGGGLAPVTERLWHRAIGCVAGGLLSAATVIAAQGWAPLLIAGTCLGIVIGRHIENSGTRPYVGVQFVLAVLVTLVPDSYADARIGPALTRLASIFIGMILLEPVLLLWHFVLPDRSAATPGSAASESE
jgi:uncharacterized membrane protein YccC